MAWIDGNSWSTGNTVGHFQARGWVFSNVGSTQIIASGGRGGSLSCLRLNGNVNATLALPANYTTLIAGTAFRCSVLTNDMPVLVFRDGTTDQIDIRVMADGRLKVTRGGTTLATSVAQFYQVNTYHHIQFKARITSVTDGNPANYGYFEARVDNVAVTWDAANTNVDTAATANNYANSLKLGGTGTVNDWSELYICDTSGSRNNDFLGNMTFEVPRPNASGNSSQWFNSVGDHVNNYSYVDDAAPNDDTDYVYSDTNAQIDLYNFADLSAASGTVLCVTHLMYAKADVAGTSTIRPVVRSGGSNATGTSRNLSTSYTYYKEIMEQNPVGPADWTISSFNAAELGMERVA